MTTPSDLPPASPLDPERPYKPADDREEVYYQGSPLLRGEVGRLLLCWIIGLVLLAAPFIWSAVMGYWPDWWFWLLCVIIAAGVLVIPVIFTRTIRYRISNYRIDYERGILTKKIDTLELWHVDDISLEQSLVDRMLRVGTISVMSNDKTTPKLELYGLPSPRPLFDSLKQRIIAVKRQRGVIKMDVG